MGPDSYYGEDRFFVSVHHRLRLLAFPMRTVATIVYYQARCYHHHSGVGTCGAFGRRSA